MHFVLDTLITVIALIFLGILGVITGLALPGLFIPALAPWLDWIVPVRKRSDTPR